MKQVELTDPDMKLKLQGAGTRFFQLQQAVTETADRLIRLKADQEKAESEFDRIVSQMNADKGCPTVAKDRIKNIDIRGFEGDVDRPIIIWEIEDEDLEPPVDPAPPA